MPTDPCVGQYVCPAVLTTRLSPLHASPDLRPGLTCLPSPLHPVTTHTGPSISTHLTYPAALHPPSHTYLWAYPHPPHLPRPDRIYSSISCSCFQVSTYKHQVGSITPFGVVRPAVLVLSDERYMGGSGSICGARCDHAFSPQLTAYSTQQLSAYKQWHADIQRSLVSKYTGSGIRVCLRSTAVSSNVTPQSK